MLRGGGRSCESVLGGLAVARCATDPAGGGAAAATDGARPGRSRGQIRVTDSLAGQPSLASSATQPTVSTARERATPSIDGHFLKSICSTTDLSFRLAMLWELWDSIKPFEIPVSYPKTDTDVAA